jgi:hypothetical protein
MVHTHVMGEVGLERLPKQRPNHPRQVMVEPAVFFLKQPPVASAVQHQPKWSFNAQIT